MRKIKRIEDLAVYDYFVLIDDKFVNITKDLIRCNSEKLTEINKLEERIDKAIEYIKDLLKEEVEITDEDNVDYGMKCQRAYFSDSELIKVLELLGDKE